MRRLIISALFAGVLLFSFLVSIAQATPNLQINYQGKLTDADSLVVADGDYDMVLNLYTASSGGSAIWSMATSTNISSGQFSIMMGASDGSTYALGALSSVNFNQTLYLGVTVGSDSEMTPRKILGAVPAAFEAVKLGGLTSSQFFRSDITNSVSSTTIAGSAVSSVNGQPVLRIGATYSSLPIGTGPSIDFFSVGSNAITGRIRSYYDGIGSTLTGLAFDTGISTPTTKMIIGSGGNVGIGTTSPYAKFSVNAIGGDTNNAIFAVASSTTAFATTTHFVILNNGNIGISTTSPFAKFSVEGDAFINGDLIATDATTTNLATGNLTVSGNTITLDYDGGASDNDVLFRGRWADDSIDTFMYWDPEGETFDYLSNVVIPEANSLTIGATHLNNGNLLRDAGILNIYTSDPNNLGTMIQNVAEFNENTGLITFALPLQMGANDIITTGNVGIGTTTPVSTLSVQGSLCVRDTGSCGTAAGTIYATNVTIEDIDLAENFSTKDDSLVAGEIVAADFDEPEYIKRAQSGDMILGIISTKPGIALGKEMKNSKPVALAGRVPVKVNGEGGAIKVGDLIGLSSVAGVGAKADPTDSTVGIALGSFSPNFANDLSTIIVFVNLKSLSPLVAGDEISGYFTFDEVAGRLKPLASLDLNNNDLLNVRSIISANGTWKIDEQGILTTTEVHTTKLCLGATCINENQLQEILQHAEVGSSPNPEPNPEPIPTSTTTPPVSEIQPPEALPEPPPEVISPPVVETPPPVPEPTPESVSQPEPSPEPMPSS